MVMRNQQEDGCGRLLPRLARLFVFLVCGASSLLSAQQWQSFSEDQVVGWPVTAAFQSSDYVMWFGSVGGLTRYDGTWTRYTTVRDMPTATRVALGGFWVRAICEADDGLIWIGTQGGASIYDRSAETFTPVDALDGVSISAILRARDGALWFASDGAELPLFGGRGSGVFRYDGEWQQFTTAEGLAHDSVRHITEAPDGAFWFATDGGVSRYDGTWQNFTTADGLGHNTVNCTMAAADGAIWIATNWGVHRYDGAWQDVTAADGLAHNTVFHILQDQDGALWFATAEGVSRYDGEWTTFTQNDGLVDDFVFATHQSPDRAFWFATFTGVTRFDVSVSWRTYRAGYDGTVPPYCPVPVMRAADGALWFGTKEGAMRFDGTQWLTYTRSDGLAGDWINAIYQSLDGTIWFGTDGGATRYTGSAWESLTTDDGLLDSWVSAISQAADGALWFGYDDGIVKGEGNGVGGASRYSGGEWQHFTGATGLDDDMVHCILPTADGAVWFGTDAGASRLAGAEWVHLQEDRYGYDFGPVRAITQAADGALWFARYGMGAARYQDGVTQEFYTLDGLVHNMVTDVVQSADGALWFATRNGVSRYDGQRWFSYSADDGLASNDVFSVCQARDGKLWFGTNSGATAFARPEVSLAQTFFPSALPPLLGVNRFFVEIRGHEFEYAGVPPVSYALLPGSEHTRIDNWSPFADIAGVELREADLDNGPWSLYARAMDRHGNIDPTPAVVRFTVDLVGPTVAISSPRSGAVVTGEVEIVGLVFDGSTGPDLEQYSVEFGRGTAADAVATWVPIGVPQSTPVENGPLATWQTEGLGDGPYVLRVAAADSLGHVSEHTVGVTLVSALEYLDKSRAGRLGSDLSSVDLQIPPNAVPLDGTVHVSGRRPADLPPPPSGCDPTTVAYAIGPAGLRFSKPATLTIRYAPADLLDALESQLATFALSGTTWTRMGGTVEAAAHEISVPVDSAGTYALFGAPAAVSTVPGVSELTCQPRIISPAGRLYPAATNVSFRLAAAGPVDVRIYTVAGNLIRVAAADRELNAGLNVVTWDGKDRNGDVVTDGLYVAVVQAGDEAADKTVAVLNR